MVRMAQVSPPGYMLVAVLALLSASAAAAADKPDVITLAVPAPAAAEHDTLSDAQVDSSGLAQVAPPSADDQRASLTRRAWAFEQTHQPKKAEDAWSQALAIEPVDPVIYAARGYFYLRQGVYAKALDDFSAGAKADPNNPLFVYGIGRVYATMKDFDTAVARYNQALALNPNYAVAILSRAEAYVHLDRLPEAKSDYDKAIILKFVRPGDRFFAFLGRGYVNLQQEDFDHAVLDFNQALEADPGSVDALLYRGYANERRGVTALALQDYERAFVENPSNAWVREGLQRLRN
jgi:tetratricopeptide (TPR) repeat protein